MIEDLERRARSWRYAVDNGADPKEIYERCLHRGDSKEELDDIKELAEMLPPTHLIRTEADIEAVTREILERTPLEMFQDVKPWLYDKWNLKIKELTPDIDEMCESAVRAFKSGDKSSRPLEFVKSLPDFLRVVAWTRLTQRSIGELEFCKHVHTVLAPAILEIFGIPHELYKDAKQLGDVESGDRR